MHSPTDSDSIGEGPGNQPGGIANQSITEQSGEGPVLNRGITGSVKSVRGVKRKMNLQTYEVKYQAILEVERGVKKKDVAQKYGVLANTISTWLKNKENIKQKFTEADIGSQRKRDKKAKFPELESALIQWFAQIRSKNIPLSGEMVREKAKQFAEQLQVSNFECSTGWLDRFKERHNLTFKKVCGESNSVDVNSVAMVDWQTKLETILKDYRPENIYNADETGLFFRMLPDKTMEFKDVQCHGGKMSKDRVTVMVCANMTGTDKSPLLVIGKSKNPRCFKNLKHIPVEYEANKKAWVTSEIFTCLVQKLDRRMTTQGRKILLMVDNCPAHPHVSGLKSVKLTFLPPNTTSHTQPMDQGVIRNFKAHYRKLMIQRQLRLIENADEPHTSLLDALHLMKSAWRLVSPTTIENCFRHAGFQQQSTESQMIEPDDDPEDDIPLAALSRLATGVTFGQYAAVDEHVQVYADATDNEIIDSVLSQRLQPSEAHDDEDDDDEHQPPKPRATILDAIKSLETVTDFLSQQGIGGDTECAFDQVSDVSNKLYRYFLRGLQRKQSTMEDFFGNFQAQD